ncbi:MAG: 1,4-alpha-glucan branching protein GlgB [Acholeplasmataceae bacterium]
MKKIDDHMIQRFFNGESSDLFEYLGAHINFDEHHQIESTTFRVYAPNAKEVRLAAEFNQYEGWKHVLTKISHHGFFEITIPGNHEYQLYKYEIHTHQGDVLYKSDPFAFYAEVRPGTASKVCDINHYEWHDQDWFYFKKKPYQEPVLIYEMHFGSWRKTYGQFKQYNQVVDELISYIHEQGFTHVEFLPIYEYPLDDSWGYQGTGFYATNSRYGSPKDLMYLIDRLHQAGIGIIVDWVLGHICKDAHGLSYFDGSPLYEFDDKHRRENEVWGTNNLDFSKGITRSFMLSALTYWMDYFHVDGYRIDAVANLIYYLGNSNEGVNQDAIKFIQQLSHHLFGKDDRFLFMAEDSTAYPKVTHPTYDGGIGFNYKWNMGFMNDVLKYFKEDPIHRKYHHHKITFGLVYAFSEQYVLPFSHDEVVHMKGSLVNKMPGDYFQKLANWRLLLTLWMTHPGKKLLFMGQEFAQFSEWAFKEEIDWHLLDIEAHQKQNRYFKDLAQVYRHHPALFQYDHDPKGFRWSVVNDEAQSVFAYIRYSDHETLVIVLNMTPNVHQTYEIGVPRAGRYEEILNSDKGIYYGSDQYNGRQLHTQRMDKDGFKYIIKPKLGPLSGMIFLHKK